MPSTLIRRFAYDDDARRLEIEFVNGAVYHYFEVPAEVAAAMRQAFAKGEFFNQHIRGAYRFTRASRAASDRARSFVNERKVTE